MNYPQAGQAIGSQKMDVHAMAQAQGLLHGGGNNINKQPRLEAAASRLEHLIEQLEKTLLGAHSHLDRVAGPSPPRESYGNGRGLENAAVPHQSQLHRLDQALDLLATTTSTLAAGVFERLGQL